MIALKSKNNPNTRIFVAQDGMAGEPGSADYSQEYEYQYENEPGAHPKIVTIYFHPKR